MAHMTYLSRKRRWPHDVAFLRLCSTDAGTACAMQWSTLKIFILSSLTKKPDVLKCSVWFFLLMGRQYFVSLQYAIV